MNQFDEVNNFPKILVLGKGRTASSICVCLAASGSEVTLYSEHPDKDQTRIDFHLSDLEMNLGINATGNISITNEKIRAKAQNLAIITGYSNLGRIQSLIEHLEQKEFKELTIAVSTDHIELKTLQNLSTRPENIIVMNWSEPAHTTFFLELVHNEETDQKIVNKLEKMARKFWNKDPYSIKAELGVRGRMFTAMLREAMYLVNEEYANIEDIDRACRNDAGTYLPFTGNFQYMDLMGTFAYGVVMEKLNQELSNATVPPSFFIQNKETKHNGMANTSGFYDYSSEDMEEWESRMRNFSFEIKSLIGQYPFANSEDFK